MLTFIAVFSLVLLGEEVGWRGYLFRRLAALPVRRRFSPPGAFPRRRSTFPCSSRHDVPGEGIDGSWCPS